MAFAFSDGMKKYIEQSLADRSACGQSSCDGIPDCGFGRDAVEQSVNDICSCTPFTG